MFAEIVIAIVIATVEPVGRYAKAENIGHNRPHGKQIHLAGITQILVFLKPGIGGNCRRPLFCAIRFFGNHVDHTADGI